MEFDDVTELTWLPSLPAVTEPQLLMLFRQLWGLPFCPPCLTSEFKVECESRQCPKRGAMDRFKSFVGYYKRVCASYDPLTASGEAALHSHDDIRQIIEVLKSNPAGTKAEIRRLAFPTEGDPVDEENALNLTLSILSMVNCRSQESSSILLEEGSNRIAWRSGIPLSHYIELVLPRREEPSPERQSRSAFLDPSCPLVMARELRRAAGTTFRGTDDITNHLRYDSTNNVLFVFHYAPFLKEQLRLSKNCGDDPSVTDYLKVGSLPRQYVLEVLDSTQKFVFPLWDSESVSMLQSLVTGSSFDKDILNGQDYDFVRDDEEKIEFYYLWPRLSEIYQEIQNPRPRGWLANWLERRSGARYVMLATVSGVTFAVLLGMASLAVSAYQAYLSYQAWQYPVHGIGAA